MDNKQVLDIKKIVGFQTSLLISKTFDATPGETYIVELDILAIDSWDAGEFPRLKINSVNVWEGATRTGGPHNHGRVVASSKWYNGNQCGLSQHDLRWQKIRKKVIVPNSGKLTVEVSSTIQQGSTNEALGMDNFRLYRVFWPTLKKTKSEIYGSF